jgi:hypothetical protein
LKVPNAFFRIRVLAMMVNATECESLFGFLFDVGYEDVLREAPVVTVVVLNLDSVAVCEEFERLFRL